MPLIRLSMRANRRSLFSFRSGPNAPPQQMGAAVRFVIVVFLSFAALAGWRAWEERKAALQQAQISTANLSRSMAQHMQDAIRVADALLSGITERVETDGLSQASLVRLESLFENVVEQTPQLHGMFLFDEQGYYLASSFGILPRQSNIDLPYFQHHLNHPDTRLFIGPPVRSRTTSDWTITVSRRLADKHGRFIGVALATIRMDYFRTFHKDFDIGKRGVMFVSFEDGVVLTRHPFKETVVGKRLTQSVITPENSSVRPAGSFTARSSVDDTERIYSYRYLEDYPLVAVAGLSRDEVLVKWHTAMLTYVAGLLAMGLILGLLGWRLLLSIRAGLNAEKNLVDAHASLQRLNRTLESMALQDALTGIPNRRQFDTMLDSEYKRALRTGLQLSVMMVDADYFKQFNDIYGHPEGDKCLRQIGQTLSRTLTRAGDLTARYGGEEFAVLLPNTDLATAEMLAQRLCKTIEELAIPHNGSPLGKVTVSLGVATLQTRSVNASHMMRQEDLMSAADQALYIAKHNGRNQICATDRHVSSFFTPENESA